MTKTAASAAPHYSVLQTCFLRRFPPLRATGAAAVATMPSQELSKEQKLDAANTAREEVKQLLTVAKEGSVNGVRK